VNDGITQSARGDGLLVVLRLAPVDTTMTGSVGIE
jgi:hypothetical protein